MMYPLTPVTALTFTRNRESLVEAINQFDGRKGDYEPRNEFEERYAYYPVETVERIRNDVTLGALKGAAVRLGGMREGRKSIIFVSEGYTSSLPPQMQRSGRGDARRRQSRAQLAGRGSGHQPARRGAEVLRLGRPDQPARARSSTSPTATTCRSTRSIRAAWRRSSTTSTRASA